MAKNQGYLMENPEENLRLEIKPREKVLLTHALSRGLEPDMQVVDDGCAPGKTTAILQKMIPSLSSLSFCRRNVHFASTAHFTTAVRRNDLRVATMPV